MNTNIELNQSQNNLSDPDQIMKTKVIIDSNCNEDFSDTNDDAEIINDIAELFDKNITLLYEMLSGNDDNTDESIITSICNEEDETDCESNAESENISDDEEVNESEILDNILTLLDKSIQSIDGALSNIENVEI